MHVAFGDTVSVIARGFPWVPTATGTDRARENQFGGSPIWTINVMVVQHGAEIGCPVATGRGTLVWPVDGPRSSSSTPAPHDLVGLARLDRTSAVHP
jgi:hypothetical protein